MAIHSLHIQGFKSIRDQSLELKSLNVFIGGNGAGKSNLVETFNFLSRITRQELALYTGQSGGANSILYFGRKLTQKLSLDIIFKTGPHENIYKIVLNPTDSDGFIFESEDTFYRYVPGHERSFSADHWAGHSESKIAESVQPVSKYVKKHLDSYRIYHFHDTSASAPPKQTCNIADNRSLRPDAGNLAAFLYYLREKHSSYYQNIEDTIRGITPFFKNFRLAPDLINPEKIRLEWEEKGSDSYFNASSLSDGTLRFMCLTTLLLQPEMPSVILIDEPELGLHPAAIHVLAGMLQSASTKTQVLVATQSVTLINQLEPEQVWVVDREEGESKFKHLKEADMSSWIENYSLGELWEKNILGGRP
jgi:predicted ATPase